MIYDLRGDGKTSVRASYSYYFATKITLANALGGLVTQPALTWGNNASRAAPAAPPRARRAGRTPTSTRSSRPTSSSAADVGSTRFNMTTGIFAPAGNTVDPSAQIGRTREFITGLQHELIPNLAVGVEYVYRKYDRGTRSYIDRLSSRAAPMFPISALYTGPLLSTPIR